MSHVRCAIVGARTPQLGSLLGSLLHRLGFSVARSSHARQVVGMLETLASAMTVEPVLVLEAGLHGGSIAGVLDELRRLGPSYPAIVIGEEGQAAEAFRHGVGWIPRQELDLERLTAELSSLGGRGGSAEPAPLA